MIKNTHTSKLREILQKKSRDYLFKPWTPIQDEDNKLYPHKGNGIYVWDIYGRKYIDCCSQNLTCGYNNRTIIKAIFNQNKLLHSFDLSIHENQPAIKCSENLAKFLPPELKTSLFVNSGSEGIEAAIFIASSYWSILQKKRKGLISLAGGYHGSTYLTKSICSIPKVSRGICPVLPVKFVDLPYEAKQMRTHDALVKLTESFKKILEDSTIPPLAVILEPLMNIAGGIVLPNGFLKNISELCKKYNTLLLLDEVFTGFGRTGKMFAFQHEQICPDILVSSKGLAGGYMPITAVTTTESIKEVLKQDPLLKGLRYGHTTSGHPVACAAANATLNYLENKGLIEKAENLGLFLEKRLSSFLNFKDVVDIRGKGLIYVIEMDSVGKAKTISNSAREKGLLVRQSGNYIKIIPPLIINIKELKKVCNILENCLTNSNLFTQSQVNFF